MSAILLIDDDELVLGAYARVLRNAGFAVDTAVDGPEALTRLSARSYTTVITDVCLPGMDGVDVLRAVRERDLDVPVVVITGDPRLETAVQALEYGATRYLPKPIAPDALVEAAQRGARLHAIAALKREALEMTGGHAWLLGDRAALEVRFEHALRTLWMAYQPVVVPRERRVFGYEALVRTQEDTLARPDALFQAAERLGRLRELGGAIRARVARDAAALPDDAALFVNVHAHDLLDEALYRRDAPLAPFASRVVLEITERASLAQVPDVRARTTALRARGYQIAVDDLGAGYAGLETLARLEPEVVKLDMSLVRGIHESATRQRVVRSMAALCSELGMLVITEGVETADESRALAACGCELFQGFLYARPARPFVAPVW